MIPLQGGDSDCHPVGQDGGLRNALKESKGYLLERR